MSLQVPNANQRSAQRKVSTTSIPLPVSPTKLPHPVTHPSSFRSPQAIRRKIESELSRKRTISTTNFNRPKRGARTNATKGTVAALKPSPALTVPETITVSDASQLCAAKRTDCVLVVDDEEGLSGIFTAKDLAYRVSVPILFSYLRFPSDRPNRSLPKDWLLALRLSVRL